MGRSAYCRCLAAADTVVVSSPTTEGRRQVAAIAPQPRGEHSEDVDSIPGVRGTRVLVLGNVLTVPEAYALFQKLEKLLASLGL